MMPGKVIQALERVETENPLPLTDKIGRGINHQENMRVIFGVFVSGNHISERYVFAKEVFQGLCLWVRIFNI